MRERAANYKIPALERTSSVAPAGSWRGRRAAGVSPPAAPGPHKPIPPRAGGGAPPGTPPCTPFGTSAQLFDAVPRPCCFGLFLPSPSTSQTFTFTSSHNLFASHPQPAPTLSRICTDPRIINAPSPLRTTISLPRNSTTELHLGSHSEARRSLFDERIVRFRMSPTRQLAMMACKNPPRAHSVHPSASFGLLDCCRACACLAATSSQPSQWLPGRPSRSSTSRPSLSAVAFPRVASRLNSLPASRPLMKRPVLLRSLLRLTPPPVCLRNTMARMEMSQS